MESACADTTSLRAARCGLAGAVTPLSRSRFHPQIAQMTQIEHAESDSRAGARTESNASHRPAPPAGPALAMRDGNAKQARSRWLRVFAAHRERCRREAAGDAWDSVSRCLCGL